MDKRARAARIAQGIAAALALWAGPGLAQTPGADEPRRWQVTGAKVALRAAPEDDAPARLTLGAGAILSNMGCGPDAAGDAWCRVRPYRGGPQGYVRATRLSPAKGPDGTIPRGPDDSARRAGKGDFDATATIPCAQEKGQQPGQCDAAVARGTGGDATLVVTFPNGFARRLFFVHGTFVSASATMSGAGRDIDWQRAEDRHLIRVDDQRYELPDSFVFGP